MPAVSRHALFAGLAIVALFAALAAIHLIEQFLATP